MGERPDRSSMVPNSIVTYIASSLLLFRWLFSLEYLDTFIILFLLAISPNNKVRKTTIHAAIMGSIGTDEALSVGSANTGNEKVNIYMLLIYVLLVCPSHGALHLTFFLLIKFSKQSWRILLSFFFIGEEPGALSLLVQSHRTSN